MESDSRRPTRGEQAQNADRIVDALESVIRRRSIGEEVGDEEVIAAHPELMPDLGSKLKALRRVQQAEQRAHSDVAPDGSPKVPPWDAPFLSKLPENLFPGYELLDEVHHGGQGVVYRAVQKTTRRQVAIKVMREGLLAGLYERARFQREARILAQLRHPGIVTIHESGAVSGNLFFVMDYIAGQALDIYTVTANLPIREMLATFAKICDAVHAAHLHGIIHRDLKPTNIIIDSDGEPHILDFGLAKIIPGQVSGDSLLGAVTVTGQFMGSLPWSSPEQADGQTSTIDVRTDVYSLGVMLYQALTGCFPYEVTGHIRDVLNNITTAEPARPSATRKQIDNEVETLVLKCLAKDPARRYQGAGELALDIRRYLNGEPIEAKRDSTLYVLRKTAHRYRALIAAAAALALVLAGALAVSLSMWYRAEEAYAREREERKLATQESTEAQTARLRADRLLYRQLIAEANREVGQKRFHAALEALGHCPEEQRNWEWGWLARQADIEAFPPRLHGALVSALAISHDGRLVASGGDDGFVRVGALGSQEQTVIDMHGEFVRAVAFSRDSKLLATSGASPHIRHWEVQKGQLVRTIEGHKHWVEALAFSPDGRQLISGSADHTIRFWEIQTGREAAEPLEGPQEVYNIALSPDGRFLVSNYMIPSSPPDQIWIWDLESRTAQIRFSGLPRQKPAFAHQSHLLALAREDDRIVLIDAATGKEVRSILTGERSVHALAFSPDGQRIAAACAHAVLLWDLADDRLDTVGEHGQEVVSVAFTPDGRYIASTGYDGALRFWNAVPDQSSLRTTIHDESPLLESIAFSPDGRRFVTGALRDDQAVSSMGVVRVRDTTTGALICELPRVPFSINTVTFHPGGRQVAAGTWGGTIHLWDVETLQEIRRFQAGERQARAVAFSPDGRFLVGEASIWETETGNKICLLEGGEKRQVICAIFSPDEKVVYGSTGREIETWDARTGRRIRSIELASSHRSGWTLALTPDGQKLLVGTLDGRCYIINTAEARVIQTIAAHRYDMTAMALSPDGSRLATAGDNILIKVWDTTNMNEVLTFQDHTKWIRGLAFSPDGRTLASVGLDGRVIVRNAYAWGADSPESAALSPDDRIRMYGWQNYKRRPIQTAYSPAPSVMSQPAPTLGQ